MNELRLILIIFGIILIIGIYWIGRREEQLSNSNDTPQNGFQKPSSLVTTSPATASPSNSSLSTKVSAQSAPEKHKHFQDNDINAATLDSEYLDDDDYIYFAEDDYISENPRLNSAKPKKARAKIASLWNTSEKSDTEQTDHYFNHASEATVQLPTGIEPLIVSLTLVNSIERNFDPHHVKQSLESTGLVFGDLDIYHYYRKVNSESGVNASQKLFSVANMVKPGCFDPQQITTYNTPGLTIFTQLPVAMDGVIVFEQMLRLGESLSKQLRGVLCDDKHNKLTQQTIMHIKDQVSEYHLKLQTKLKRSVH